MSNADVLVEGFSRCGVRRTALLAEHMQDGVKAINLAMVKLSNLVPNLWAYEEYQIPLVAGTTTYTVPARTVMILSAFIRTGTGTTVQDRILWPVSEFEYASFPNKSAQGFPSVYWFNRLINPVVNFYLTPDGTQTYTVYLQLTRQLQDVALTGGQTPDIPYRFYDALCAEVAHRLSRVYAPDKEAMRKQDAAEAWSIAATTDVENVSLNIVPAISAYRSW